MPTTTSQRCTARHLSSAAADLSPVPLPSHFAVVCQCWSVCTRAQRSPATPSSQRRPPPNSTPTIGPAQLQRPLTSSVGCPGAAARCRCAVCVCVCLSYVKEWLGVSVSGDGGVQSMLDSQQRLLAEREAEIAQLRRRVAQLEEEAAQRTRGVEGELPAAAEEAAAAAVIKVDAPSPVAS